MKKYKLKTQDTAYFSLAIHGGASHDKSSNLSTSVRKNKKMVLSQSLEAGYQILQEGGSSLDAVQAAVIVLEDSEYFNAGKGAVLTKDKTVELDASLMSSDSRAVYLGFPLEEAAFRAIFEELASVGGQGGLIALDAQGHCVMPFSTLSMSRGYWQAGGNPMVSL